MRVARGLWARRRRWSGPGCDAYDGRLDDPALLEDLARRYPGRTVFSASAFVAMTTPNAETIMACRKIFPMVALP